MIDLHMTPERADAITARILLDIYQEFCYQERDQARWEAGWATICAIGPFPVLERGKKVTQPKG